MIVRSEFDRLAIDNGTESFSMFDSLMALSMQKVLLAAYLHGEQIRLLKSLNQLLLVLKLANLRDFDIPRTADTGSDSECLAIFVEFNFTNSRTHDSHRFVSPVKNKCSCSDL